jgi:hypothetical protein
MSIRTSRSTALASASAKGTGRPGGVGGAQPAGFGGVAQEGLQDRQGDQLGVGQLGWDADRWSPWPQPRVVLQALVDGDVQCGGEGVQVGVHEVDVGFATPIMDTLPNQAPLGINRLALACARA